MARATWHASPPRAHLPLSQPATTGEGTTLSRGLAEFLIELSIALHKHAIYPNSHPLVMAAIESVARRLESLLAERPTLSLGVARKQLVIEGVATDPNNPVLSELAARLHRQHLGAVRFSADIGIQEITEFLRVVAADVSRQPQPLGLGPKEALERWKHIGLYPLTYGQLELVQDESGEPPAGESGTRAAQLWVGLARAALAADSSGDAAASDPTLVAKAIDDHQRDVAYDQVVVGYLLQIAEELKGATGSEATALQRRVSQLVGRLRPETLKQLLEMGGSRAQRRKFVLDASQGMAVDAVVDLVKAAADDSKQTISHSLVRLLSKLATHAEHGTQSMRPEADAALRENVRRLISDWELDDPNPDAYRGVLDGMARAAPVFVPVEVVSPADAERIVAMSLEAGSLGPMVWRAVETMVERGRTEQLVGLLERAQPEARETADALWLHIATPERMRLLLDDRVDGPLLERLVARMGVAAAEPMLDLLERAQDRTTRWRLLDRLTQIGDDVGPIVARRIDGSPWYVQRNMLVLLSRLAKLPTGFSPLLYASNPDARVRREAVKMLLKDPATRERVIYTALADADERVAHMALTAASESCPRGAVPLITARLAAKDLSPDSRALGIRALASLRTPDILEMLLRLTTAGKTFFGRQRLAPKSPEMLAALGALCSFWSKNEKALGVLTVAGTHPDPEIRMAATPGVRPRPRVATPSASAAGAGKGSR